MTRQFTDWYLVGCFLHLEDLLVDELAALVHDVVWIQRASVVVLSSLAAACAGEGNTRETAGHGQGFFVLAIPASEGEGCGFGGEGRGANDDAWYAYKARDGGGGQVTDGKLRSGRVEEQLVLGQLDGPLRGVDDALCARLERSLEQRDDFGRVLGELVGQLLVERDEVCNVDVAVVLLDEHVFADLVSGNGVSGCVECLGLPARTCKRRRCRGESP